MKGLWWFMAGAALILFAIDAIPALLSPATYVDEELLTGTEQAIDFATTILSILLFPITVGWLWLNLDIIRQQDVSIERIFRAFTTMYWKSVWVNILMGFFLFFWTLLLIIPGIIKSFSYSLTIYILHDRPELSALEAITESRKMMDGYKGQAFLLTLSFIGWFILGILTLGIGFLFIYPYYSATYARFYEEIKEGYDLDEVSTTVQ
nr:DUF975 family protein [Bhargavaea cecembensis]